MKNTVQKQWTGNRFRKLLRKTICFFDTSFGRFPTRVAAFLAAAASSVCAAESGALPAEIASAIRQAGLAPSAVAVWVAPAGSVRPVLALNADRPMQPASTIKIVTTLSALDLLGPAYTFRTEFRASGLPDARGVVSGLTVRGSGDPHYVIERLWLAAQRLAGLGVKAIEGDITLDRSLFDLARYRQGEFDGRSTRTYNVGADPLMVSFKSMTLTITPLAGRDVARVTALPVLNGVSFPKTVKLAAGACGDWKTGLGADLSNPRNLRFKGSFPASCGEKALHLSLWSADEYFTRAFQYVLGQSGIVWKGRAVGSRAAAGDAGTLLYEDVSEPLAQSVYWTNKFSNNPMARQIFLALSFAADGARGRASAPASLEKSRRVLARWLVERAGVDDGWMQPAGKPGKTGGGRLYVDNGSGLSRSTRISARALGEVLSYGFRSRVMPEFMASLPIAGVDGTMKRRPLRTGSGHVKTGFLTNVRAAAGYVADDALGRWSVVVFVNADPMPDKAQAVTQAVLEWCADGGARRALGAQRTGSGVVFEGAALP